MEIPSPNKVYLGDVLTTLKTWPDNFIQCVVTSPPYFGLRDYGTAKWEGGDPNCDHKAAKEKSRYDYALKSSPIQDGSRTGTDAPKWKDDCPTCGARKVDLQVGLEKTPEDYIEKLVLVFREIRRCLREDGTCWLNLGDSYWGGKGQSGQGSPERQAERSESGESINQSHHQIGGPGLTRPLDGKHSLIKPKDLCLIPAAVAIALRNDGWYLRAEIIRSLGQFDLDPCSPVDRPWDTALKHYTVMDDGLKQEWKGRVWCNPPYGPHMKLWAQRMMEHGNGVFFIFARTETKIFMDMFRKADGFLFLAGRMKFHKPDGSVAQTATAPSVLVAFGERNAESLRNSDLLGAYFSKAVMIGCEKEKGKMTPRQFQLGGI